MKNIIPLNKLNINCNGRIKEITCTSTIKRRLFDLGIIPDTIVTPVFKSTGGNPIAYEIRGILLAIRNEDAKNILVESI